MPNITTNHAILPILIYLFIYKHRQEAWITQRASSTTPEKKKKISTTNKNDLETTKKGMEMKKTELGRTSIKNQHHVRSSKLFNGRPKCGT